MPEYVPLNKWEFDNFKVKAYVDHNFPNQDGIMRRIKH